MMRLTQPSQLKTSSLLVICACLITTKANAVTVNSLAELRSAAATMNNTTITFAPGEYWMDGDHITDPSITAPVWNDLGGTNNTYDLSAATFKIDTRELAGFGRSLGHDSTVFPFKLTGTNNTLIGLELESQDVFDPGASRYEQRYADWGTTYLQVTGDGNSVQDANITTRGSYPYGYGDVFGKGARQDPQGFPADEGGLPWIAHRKSAAMQVWGATDASIDDIHLNVFTYGHGFFVQQSTDTTLTNSTVTGELFSSNDVIATALYQEYGFTSHGNELPEDILISGAEDGVRVYTGASGFTVDNVEVTNMRTGFAVTHDGGNVSITNSTTIGGESGFDVGNNTTILNSKADISNGPLLWFPSSSQDTNNTIEIELIGDMPVGVNWSAAYLNGSGIDVTISRDPAASALPEESYIRLGQTFFEDWRDTDSPTGPDDNNPNPLINSTFTNNTDQMIVMGENVSGNTGYSQAPVISNGKDNAYDGVTLVPAGSRLEVQDANGVGNPGTESGRNYDNNGTIVEDGATLEINPNIRVQEERVTITGDGVDGNGAIYSDGTVGNGTRLVGSGELIVLNGDASIGVGVAGNQLLADGLSGVGNFTKLGPGMLSLGTASSFAGDFLIAEGRIEGRNGVVQTNLTVAAGASVGAIADYTIDAPSSLAVLNGILDLNTRTDSTTIPGRIGSLTGSGEVIISNTSVGAGGVLEIVGASGTSDFSGVISTQIDLVKSGNGTQKLSGNNTYAGTTAILAGTLLINGVHTGGDAYNVAGGTLGGNGSIDADIVVGSGGTLAPGASAGQLTVEEIAFMTGATLEIEIGGAAFGTEYDQLLADMVTLDGDLSISLLDLGGGTYVPSSGSSFRVLLASSITGEFDNVASGERIDTVGGEGSFLVSYNGLAVQLSNFIPSTTPGDFDFDGDVDGADFLVWQRDGLSAGLLSDWQLNYGQNQSLAAQNVPEPASVVSYLISFIMVLLSRIRACRPVVTVTSD